MKRAVNLSTVFQGFSRDERPAAAATRGWKQAESWWEFTSAVPESQDFEEFLVGIEASGIELIAVNAYGGNRQAGERGITGLADRGDEFRASVEGIIAVYERTGASRFNTLIGNVSPQADKNALFAVAAERYRWACSRLRAFGGTLLIEPLAESENPDYPFHTGYDVAEFLSEYLPDVQNIGMLFDTYHLASNGVDPVIAARDLGPYIRHVQFADAPGRGAPGTGAIDFSGVEAALANSRYDGYIALEYLA